MALVTILFPPDTLNVYFRKDQKAVIHQAFASGEYTERSSTFYVAGETGEDMADEAFDLTNNPSRQDERELVYGRGRSLSVGDIVDTGTEQFACLSFGWAKL